MGCVDVHFELRIHLVIKELRKQNTIQCVDFTWIFDALYMYMYGEK